MQDDQNGAVWLKATGEQIRELARIRRMVSLELRKLRRKLRRTIEDDASEDYVAEVIRLSQLQMKLIPLEQGLRRDMAEAHTNSQEPRGLSEEDWQLLHSALLRRGVVSPDSQGASAE